MYHSFFQHLLLRLPPRLADHVVGLLGQFATGGHTLGCCLQLLPLLRLRRTTAIICRSMREARHWPLFRLRVTGAFAL
jgi:hypothetical protein